MLRRLLQIALSIAALAAAGAALAQSDPLPSWNEGPEKARIVGSV